MTKFIPDWVKVAVVIALGPGAMIGWKRIRGYAQAAAAELVAMGTIFAADQNGIAGQYHSRPLLWRSGNDGRQPFRLSAIPDCR
jgi:hypothetical protein